MTTQHSHFFIIRFSGKYSTMEDEKYIQQGILVFWALWFSLVTAADIANLMVELDIFSKKIDFNSNNYNLILQYFDHYHYHNIFVFMATFNVIILSSFVISILFWMALFQSRYAVWAFSFSFLQTGLFIIGGEVFIQYALEHGHVIRLILQVTTFSLFLNINRKIGNRTA